eukprot:scaffold3649_cov30-Tisochrysis_lutea.AAC.3
MSTSTPHLANQDNPGMQDAHNVQVSQHSNDKYDARHLTSTSQIHGAHSIDRGLLEGSQGTNGL